MPRKRLILRLSMYEKKELETILGHSRNDSYLAQRCRIILMTEQGIPLQEIADHLGLSKTTVNTWRQVFKVKRVPGLVERKPVGRPPKSRKKVASAAYHGVEDRTVPCAAEPCRV